MYSGLYSIFTITIISLSVGCKEDSGNSFVSDLKLESLMNSNSEAHQLCLDNISILEIRDDWEFYGTSKSLLACDSTQIYISGTGMNDMQGISAYFWNGQNIWTLEDSIINDQPTNNPAFALDASSYELVASYLGKLIIIDKQGTGNANCIYPESCLAGFMFGPTEVHLIGNRYVLLWPSVVVSSTGIAMTVTDEKLNCIWEMIVVDNSEQYFFAKRTCDQDTVSMIPLPIDSMPSRLPGFNSTCSDSTIFLNPEWVDLILEFDINGNVLRGLTGVHSNVVERLLPVGGMVYKVRNVISQIQYLDSNKLVILYGPGAFSTDSTEVWCVNLKTGQYGILPLSRSATGFAVTNNNIVLSSCFLRQDTSSVYWQAINGTITTGSWDLTGIE